MRYGLIVEWIDSELARLQAARRMLTEPGAEALPVGEGQDAEPVKRGRAVKSATGVETQPPEEPQAVAPEQEATSRRVTAGRQRAKQAAGTGALSGSIPAGAVAIAPAAVEMRQAAPVVAASARPEQEPPEDGTLDALVRDLQVRRGSGLETGRVMNLGASQRSPVFAREQGSRAQR